MVRPETNPSTSARRAGRAWALGAMASLIVLVVLAALSPWTSSQEPGLQVRHTEPSTYSPIVVYDESGVRCMTFGSLHAVGRQTCQDLADPRRMVFDYTRMVMASLLFVPEPESVLIIGLGGGTLPTALSEIFPGAHIDTVELDPAVLRVAQEYFGFRLSERQQVHLADGRVFIEQAVTEGHHYDLIVLDAFDVSYIPEHLMTREFLEKVHKLLTNGGVLVANTFTTSQQYHQESATYGEVFGPYYQIRRSNRVIFAQPGDLPNKATLQERARTLAATLNPYGVDLVGLAQAMTREPEWPAGTEVLTDAEQPDPAQSS